MSGKYTGTSRSSPAVRSHWWQQQQWRPCEHTVQCCPPNTAARIYTSVTGGGLAEIQSLPFDARVTMAPINLFAYECLWTIEKAALTAIHS